MTIPIKTKKAILAFYSAQTLCDIDRRRFFWTDPTTVGHRADRIVVDASYRSRVVLFDPSERVRMKVAANIIMVLITYK